eukprot:UN19871
MFINSLYDTLLFLYYQKNFVFRLRYQVVMLNKLVWRSRFRHHQLYSLILIHGSM